MSDLIADVVKAKQEAYRKMYRKCEAADALAEAVEVHLTTDGSHGYLAAALDKYEKETQG